MQNRFKTTLTAGATALALACAAPTLAFAAHGGGGHAGGARGGAMGGHGVGGHGGGPAFAGRSVGFGGGRGYGYGGPRFGYRGYGCGPVRLAAGLCGYPYGY